MIFFARIGRSDLTKKLEKVGPFECDELEKHCRVSAFSPRALALEVVLFILVPILKRGASGDFWEL